ncbi:hypothetical protein ACQEXU_13250 [Vibrio sp. TRT 21S02]|uniref:hypothetical protein n=1 Tax=Vibrio sp. TRT 21S02 TaxID=3418507 RepID=UPI003CF4C907
MAKTLISVPCPACGSDAEIRSRGGARSALDLKCPDCGVLSFQTRAGQARLQKLVDDATKAPVELPENKDSQDVDHTGTHTGEAPEKKGFWSGFNTLMD